MTTINFQEPTMPPITPEAIEAKQSELDKMIQTFKQQANQPVLRRYPEADILLHPGEHYAGAVLDQNGQHQHHLVLLAARPASKLNWKDAMDWTAGGLIQDIGGHLPTRQEMALLYANCKPHLEPTWYWSCETHEEDASYAWYCYFLTGYQYGTHKSYEGSVVAVRRV